MNRLIFLAFGLVMGTALIVMTSGTAFSYPGHHGWRGQQLTQEQQTAAQEILTEHNKQCAPMLQQLMTKRSELDALYYGQSGDSNKMQELRKEIADIEGKLFTAEAELRKKLASAGISGGYGGMHHGCGHW